MARVSLVRYRLPFISLSVLLMLIAAAPATQPSRPEWNATVAALGRAVAGNDSQTLPTLVMGEVTMQRFDGTPVAPTKLFALPAKRTLLFAKAYARAPDTLASDISGAARGWKIA